MNILKLIDGKKTVLGVAILAAAKVLFPDQVTMTESDMYALMHNMPVQAAAVADIKAQFVQGGGGLLAVIGIIHHIIKAWRAKKAA